MPAHPTHTLLCLHGFGSNGHDLLPLAPAFQQALGKLGETLAVFCPDAPTPTPMGHGYQWFRDAGWTFRDERGLAALQTTLQAYIKEISETYGIKTTDIALLGFSQGAMGILHALPALQPPVAGVIACSGALTVPPTAHPASTATPILFLHGAEDDVLPADASVTAAAYFEAQGYPTQLEILPGLGHGINAAGLAHISVFLQTLWGSATSAPGL